MDTQVVNSSVYKSLNNVIISPADMGDPFTIFHTNIRSIKNCNKV